jgi:hypothetical protein
MFGVGVYVSVGAVVGVYVLVNPAATAVSCCATMVLIAAAVCVAFGVGVLVGTPVAVHPAAIAVIC